VVVYSKLPRGFFIPTPVGDYNPDWAIVFEQTKQDSLTDALTGLNNRRALVVRHAGRLRFPWPRRVSP